MLAISKSAYCANSSVEIVPCRINHTGTTKITKRHWQPKVEPDGMKTAYFRGRRLRGRVVKIPKQYKGLVLKSSDKVIVEVPSPIDEDDDEEPALPETVKVVEQIGIVEDLTVWGHDALPPADDALIKGIEEWIALAEAIHGAT